jgi:hypothetical protein
MNNREWKTLELKFKDGGWLGHRDRKNELLCPQCDFNYLHIVRVIVARKSDDIVVEKDKVEVRKGGSPTRGNVIAMEYVGECGHRGLIIFNFHEGNVHVWHRKLPESKRNREDIYRD